ncbi:OprD family outer membrane porin [Pseudomonas sp. NA-150]|uniref:OprD family outer membrane porin n=1 Tax=Pseudomonas sp. NA-150 TaxID=3367525 RepID=UPI0037C84844
MKKQNLAATIALAVLSLHAQADDAAKPQGFLEASKLSLSSRTYYNENDDHSAGGINQRETVEVVKLDYKSGFTQGMIGVGIDAQMIYGLHLEGGPGHHLGTGSTIWPSDRDNSAQDDLARGDANVKFRLSKTELHVGGALAPQLPILLANDSRPMPQNFDGGMITSKEIDNLTLNAGQLEHSTGRASTNSTALSVAGATKGSNQFRYAGGDYKVTKDLTVQYYYANLEDFYKQHFFGLVHLLPLGDEQSFKTDLRYFNSSSDGKNSSDTAGYAFNNNGGYAKHAGEVDNVTWSTMFTYQLGGSKFLLGYQSVSDNGGFVALNQGNVTADGKPLAKDGSNSEDNGGNSYYLYTNALIGTFIRAGEDTSFGQYSYDFVRLGVPGLSVFVNYMRGNDIKDAKLTGVTHTEWERDAGVDYVIQSGYLKGFGTSLRTGSYHAGGTGIANQDQTRLIFNYTYNFL